MNKERVQKKLQALLSKNENNCSKCKVEYTGHCHTYMAIDMQKRPQIVGDCCIDRMKIIHAAGIFTMEKGLSESQVMQLRNDLLRTHPYRDNIQN